ncbi:hypothetical protein GCM10012279_28290 [Micromonospora yangpuensis]|nr:hypothetical protein GCM10012279_28290 [Micromonospora yangpuensis]
MSTAPCPLPRVHCPVSTAEDVTGELRTLLTGVEWAQSLIAAAESGNEGILSG